MYTYLETLKAFGNASKKLYVIEFNASANQVIQRLYTSSKEEALAAKKEYNDLGGNAKVYEMREVT